MTPKTALGVLAIYFLATLCVGRAICSWAWLDLDRTPGGARLCSIWVQGKRSVREVSDTVCTPRFYQQAKELKGEVVEEHIVAEGPIIYANSLLLGLSIVAGRDGIKATHQGRTVYLSATDLLARQLYGKGLEIASIELKVGVDAGAVVSVLAEEFSLPPGQVLEHVAISRFVARREPSGSAALAGLGPQQVDVSTLKSAARAAAIYLAEHVKQDGIFEYLLDPTSNQVIPGYSWPRHAGATLFLAEAAHYLRERAAYDAAQRAAEAMRTANTLDCGSERCVGSDTVVDLGSSALALLAYVEVVEAGVDASFAEGVRQLAGFLRSQQRPDGQFCHFYDRQEKRPIDRQVPYYSGEAGLALLRAHRITRDPRDLEAAQRVLDYLVGRGWQFFGNRYYYGEEHWTCQLAGEMWAVQPNREALDFCLRWHQFLRAQQLTNYPDLAFEGGFGIGPFATPGLAPTGSRTEAAVPILVAATAALRGSKELDALDLQIRRSLAYALRAQFLPGPSFAMVDPSAVRGALPYSPIDLQVRIDIPQHVGSAMIRYARYLESLQNHVDGP